jgi:hypothetical protein
VGDAAGAFVDSEPEFEVVFEQAAPMKAITRQLSNM